MVSSRQDRRYYLTAEGEEDENGTQKIDIFDSDMSDADRQFDFYGAFHITPRLGLTGEVGISLISTTVERIYRLCSICSTIQTRRWRTARCSRSTEASS